MSLPLLMLICLSVVQLCVGDLPIIVPENVPQLGGWNEKDPKSVNVQEAAQYGVKMFNEQSKAEQILISVTKAEAQVSNVIHYKIEAILGKNLAKKKLKCNFEVTFDPRNNQHSLLSHKCSKIMRKAQ